MNQEAKDLYYFILQTIIEKDLHSLKDLRDHKDLTVLYAIRNFCIDAEMVANKPTSNEGK